MKVDGQLLTAVSGVARAAGAVLAHMRGQQLTRTTKPHAGFVTEADLASERLLIEQLSALMPEATVWSEEAGKKGSCDGWQWVIDPLDGTSNFAAGLPYYNISIALTYAGKPQLAVVYAPTLDELFCARVGAGTTRNGVPVRVTDRSLEQALIVTELPYEQADGAAISWRNMHALRAHGAGIRQMGSAALDLAYCAAGVFDGVFFHGLAWWDVAAGALLLAEAGAQVTDFAGQPIDAAYTSFVAAGPRLYGQMRALVQL